MTRAATFVLALALLVASSSPATAQPALPVLTDTVNDFAGVIDDDSRRELDRRIRALQQATGDVIVVATLDTIEPFATIDELAVELFENAGKGIGQKGQDNGALVVLAMKERRVRIETGYDLEEFITDGFAGETIREVMTPHFRQERYGAGLLAGTTRLINRVAARRGVELQDVPAARAPVNAPREFNAWPLIVVVWVFFMILSNRRRRRGRRRRWGGGPWSGWHSGVGPFGGGFGGGFGGFGGGGFGGGGGGFGGFGGGRSGGGGASGGW